MHKFLGQPPMFLRTLQKNILSENITEESIDVDIKFDDDSKIPYEIPQEVRKIGKQTRIVIPKFLVVYKRAIGKTTYE